MKIIVWNIYGITADLLGIGKIYTVFVLQPLFREWRYVSGTVRIFCRISILLIRPLLLLSLSLMQLWYLRPHSDMPVKVLTYNVRMCVRGSYCHDFFPILRIRNQSSVSVRIFCRIHTGISLNPGLKDIRLLSMLHLQDNHLPVSHRP